MMVAALRALEPLSAATPGGIVIARGLVLEHSRKTWVRSLAGRDGELSRFRMLHLCRVGRSTDHQRPKAKTHRIIFAFHTKPSENQSLARLRVGGLLRTRKTSRV